MRTPDTKQRLLKHIGGLLVLLTVLTPVAFAQPLSGTIHVGTAQSAPFNTLGGTVHALNTRGVTTPGVTFLLDDATYNTGTTALTIKDSSANPPSSAAPVTFKPNTSMRPLIQGSVNTKGIFDIFTTNWIIFDGSNTSNGTSRDLTIQNTGAAGCNTIWIGSSRRDSSSNFITLKNCNLINGSTAYINVVVASVVKGSSSPNPGWFSNITFQNDSIATGYTGIWASGDSASQNVSNGSNLTVDSCVITNLKSRGLDLNGIAGINAIGNHIYSISANTTDQPVGIGLGSACKNATVSRNWIHDIAWSGSGPPYSGGTGIGVGTGLGTSVSSNITISNNMIANMTGPGDTSGQGGLAQRCPKGIYLSPGPDNGAGQTGISIFYNTINLYGNTLNLPQAQSLGIAIDAGQANIENNIFINNLGVTTSGSGIGAIAIYNQANNFLSLNYNDYFTNASNSQNFIGRIGNVAGGTFYSTLAAWKSGTNRDTNSSAVNVSFQSSTNLHITGTSSDGDHNLIGTPIGITIDYDGQSRSSNFPYMGADEASTPLPVTLATFTAQPVTDGAGVSLQWTTLSEVNNYGFYIQRRSQDDQQFADLPGSFTPGHGTSIQPHQYAFVDKNVPHPGIYYYRLRQVDLDGSVHFSDPAQVNLTVLSVGETTPLEFSLSQNYPNPFNPTTNIVYDLKSVGRVRLRLYDVLGREVLTLVDDIQSPGRHQVTVDGSNLASGVYVYRLQAGTFVATKRMILVR